ncbi:MAG: hypothetical protein K8W52_05365 [Deltaproteobacteria bacterium]|nr:hypothetical protein [Deltaproteobacteria bacterium]
MIAPVAVIAWRWRTALGADIEAAVTRMLAGESGAIANPEPAYRVRAIAPIAGAPPRTRHDRFVRRLGAFAIDAATQVAAGLAPDLRLGLYSAVGGLRAHWDDMLAAFVRQRDDGIDAWALGLREIHPFWMLRHLSNNVHALLAADLGARGDGATYGGASAGAQAIAAAAWALHAGAIDTAIVVAHDSLLEPETLVELGERDQGQLPGEAAAALVLVRPDDPRARDRLASVAAFAGAGAPTGDAMRGAIDAFSAMGPIDLVDGDHALPAATARTAIAAAFGEIGAVTPLVQTIALAGILKRTRARVALGLAAGEPDLITAIRIEVPA